MDSRRNGTQKKRVPLCLTSRFIFGDDFNPVSIRIGDEIDSHGFVDEHHDAHLFMFLPCRSHILCRKRKMILALAEVVWHGAVLDASQFEREIARTVTQEYQSKIVVINPSNRRQSEGFAIKRETVIQIEHVKVEMVKSIHF